MQDRQGLWLRGIPEKPNICEMQDEICLDVSFKIDPTRILRRSWGTDGSGGKYSSDPNLRRVGWGAVFVAEIGPAEQLRESSGLARDCNDESSSGHGPGATSDTKRYRPELLGDRDDVTSYTNKEAWRLPKGSVLGERDNCSTELLGFNYGSK